MNVVIFSFCVVSQVERKVKNLNGGQYPRRRDVPGGGGGE